MGQHSDTTGFRLPALMHHPRLLRIGGGLLALVIIIVAGWAAGVQIATVKDKTEVEQQKEAQAFDAAKYVDGIWASRIVPKFEKDAVDLPALLNALVANQSAASEQYGVRPSTSDAVGEYYFMVKGEGRVISVDSETSRRTIDVNLKAYNGPVKVTIAIGPVFSTNERLAIRDAYGLTLDNFKDQMEYGAVATELNNRVRDSVIASLDVETLPGSTVEFYGAFSLKDLREIVILPVIMNVKPDFNAAGYVDTIWDDRVVPTITESAVDLSVLLSALESDPQAAAEQYGHYATGAYSFMVKAQGIVDTVQADPDYGVIQIDLEPYDGQPDAAVQIGPVIEGAALRDAVGFINYDDFESPIEHSMVNAELNARVSDTVVSNLDRAQLQGRLVVVVGAFTLTSPDSILITPIQLQISAPPLAAQVGENFDPAQFVASIWDVQIVPTVKEKAMEFSRLMDFLKVDISTGAQLGVESGGKYHFMVKGEGQIVAVHTESQNGTIDVDVAPLTGEPDLTIQIGPVIKGFALRDALEFLTIDLVNGDQARFGALNRELNVYVSAHVIRGLDPAALDGRTVSFYGAFTLDDVNNIVATPVEITVTAGSGS